MQGAVAGNGAHYEHLTPLVLAGMDLDPPAQKPLAAWPQLYAHVEARLAGLRIWRYSRWRRAALLAQYILPYRYHWLVTPNVLNRGEPRNASIIDSTATQAMRVAATGLFSGLMSPWRPWFKLSPQIENFEIDAEGRKWLDDTTDRILAVMAGSNFYKVGAQMFEDVATFATSPMILYEDEVDVIRCYLPCMGEYYLGSGARLEDDTLYREYTYTVAQIVEWFGLAACPDEIRGMWTQGGSALEKEYVVAHAIEPNFPLMGRDGNRLPVLSGGFAYREVYWLRGHPGRAPLSLRGFHEKPFVVSRWVTRSNDAYAFGPGDDALGDTIELQMLTREKGRVIQQISKPSMGANPELENKPSSIIPGETTFVSTSNGQKGFWPLFEPNPQAIPALTEDIKEVQGRINRAYRTDVFLMISQMEGIQPRNELELQQRIGEKIQQLGPVIENFEGEFATPAVERIIAIMFRRNLLKPPPPSLRGIPIGVEYTSQMKLAQNAAQTAVIERAMAFLGGLTEGALAAGEPPPIRIVNMDDMGRDYADRVGLPARLLYSKQQIAENDALKAKQQAANQALQASLPAVQAAEGLSRIPVGGGMSAVGALLGSGAPPSGAQGNAA